MARYAATTEVPSDRSRAEIERTLARYGATSFLYGWQEGEAVIMFEMHARRIRFVLPMPDSRARAFTYTPIGKVRSAESARAEFEQAVRQRWRALALAVKAKLEAVEAGITSFEEEFLAHVVLPDGETVGRWMAPQIERAYAERRMPAMLPAPAGA
jgi:hypothetical protein